MLGLALFLSACSGAPGGEGESRAQLLAMHEQVLEAHRTGDVERWMAVEGDDYVSANGGTITFPTTGERRAMREPYLLSTSFEVYRDLQDPIVGRRGVEAGRKRIQPTGLTGHSPGSVGKFGVRA
jgi:hypothetical protein